MQRKVYCGCDSDFKRFYQSQAGAGFGDIEVFRGLPYQRGYGIGSLVKRFGIPILRFVGKHALKTGINVGQDVLSKKNIKQSMRERGKAGLREAAKASLAKAGELLEQKGSGIRRKRLYKKRKRKTVKKKTVKRKKRDIFG